MKQLLALSLSTLTCVVLALLSMSNTQSVNKFHVEGKGHLSAKSYYVQELMKLDSVVDNLIELSTSADKNRIQKSFVEARKHYKHIEYVCEFFFRETALKINGPNLLEASPQQAKLPLYPTGFQVVEEYVFSSEALDRNKLKDELGGLKFAVNKLKNHNSNVTLNESNLLYALKLNVYRLITKGITGFDSPVSLNSIEEAKFTLESMLVVSENFHHSEELLTAIDKAYHYLEGYSGDFDSFDRAFFIKNHLNKITEAIANYTENFKIRYPNYMQFAIRPDAKTMFDEGAFDLSYFSPEDALPLNASNVALGKMLFFETNLSLDNSRSCATCHNPELAFTDGKKLNTVLNSEKELKRNTPSLVNAALQTMQFYDGRVAFLEDQAHAVITNKEEMGGDFHNIPNQLLKQKKYKEAFAKVYGDKVIGDREIKLALAAFTRSLTSLDASFDKYMRGEDDAMNKDEVNGFNLFMGKGKCATCHFVPLFNGVAPPFYEKMESEVLGVPNQIAVEGAKVDSDLGKYEVYKIEHHKHSFKTTTVRNVELTSPYMHNGVFNTLEEIVDFYNEGGGRKYGFELENQTLPFDELNLSDKEKADLVLFMKSLTDTSFVE